MIQFEIADCRLMIGFQIADWEIGDSIGILADRSIPQSRNPITNLQSINHRSIANPQSQHLQFF
jgi:hypothetical protein